MRSTKEFAAWAAQCQRPLRNTTASIACGPGPSGEDALVCPRCGTNNLHHGRVTVYDRGEDEPRTAIVVVDGSELSRCERKSIGSGNPSSRRHGLAILFTCEHCATWSELTIEQHKGETYLHWREPEESAH